jgi:lysozyme
VELKSGDLPPVLYVETIGKNSPEKLRGNVLAWLRRVESHYGVKPIIYASYKFKERYLNDSVFNSYPYWIAHYYVDSVRYEGKWQFWQHSDIGIVSGIDNDVDLNVFNGSLDELRALTIK